MARRYCAPVHVTWLGHASLYVNVANRTLLLDPWFHEPVFAGAWFRYPPSPFADSSTMPKPDFVCLSHTHADHASVETLSQLRDDQLILAVDFPSGAMRRRLSKAQRPNVKWLKPWETNEVSPGLNVTFVPHDAGWEVTSIVISGEGSTLYHGNDNTLSVDAYGEVAKRLGPISIAFLPHAGASSYPTNFDSDETTRLARCQEKKEEGLKRFLDGIEGLRPAEAAPFAASWALLEQSELSKNFADRYSGIEVLARAMQFAHERDSHLVHLEPGDEWSPETGGLNRHLVEQWPQTPDAIRRYAELERRRVQLAIETVRQPSRTVANLEETVRAFFTHDFPRSAAKANVTHSFGLRAGDASWTIRLENGTLAALTSGVSDVDEVLTLPPHELEDVLLGRSSWEDVWYGYRLHVTKKPGSPYPRAFWEMLLAVDPDLIVERRT